MSDINTIVASGRLTRDAEIAYSANETAVTKFAIASNRRYKENEYTTYLECVLFGARGENLVEYLTKGKYIIVQGRLTMDDWTDKQGNKRRSFYVAVDNISFTQSNGKQSKEKDGTHDEANESQLAGSNIPF